MKESSSNIGLVCAEHAPKPGKYAHMTPTSLIGSFVKKAFVSAEGRLEHMWVLVHKVTDGVLEGELNNDPVLVTTLNCGDTVQVRMDEIEDTVAA